MGALFRINKIRQGQILVDGVDITTVCPYKIRNRLAIIPQDQVIFSGTVRDNLDPCHEYEDDRIWSVLNSFQLNKCITHLDEEISDDQFSSGQRQLMCCARAFLRDSKVLIMDESTAALDKKSELIVLKQIFESNKTIIVIAHNIEHIANFDRVLVVDKGRIVEFDRPERLLDNEQTLFYSLYHKQVSSLNHGNHR